MLTSRNEIVTRQDVSLKAQFIRAIGGTISGSSALIGLRSKRAKTSFPRILSSGLVKLEGVRDICQ